MTAFYMFRLMSMTFFGNYRGPAWEHATPAAVHVAAAHGAPHPVDPHAHGQAHKAEHECRTALPTITITATTRTTTRTAMGRGTVRTNRRSR